MSGSPRLVNPGRRHLDHSVVCARPSATASGAAGGMSPLSRTIAILPSSGICSMLATSSRIAGSDGSWSSRWRQEARCAIDQRIVVPCAMTSAGRRACRHARPGQVTAQSGLVSGLSRNLAVSSQVATRRAGLRRQSPSSMFLALSAGEGAGRGARAMTLPGTPASMT